MFGIGIGEIVLILALIILFMGGRKIPELARGLGAGIRNFKVGMRDDDPQLGEGDGDAPDKAGQTGDGDPR
ncbi:MAG: twin-arginine translocase TatA/TatE family subunit [Gemmatimonadota bacterium]